MGVGLIPLYEPQVAKEAQFDGDGKGLADEYATLNKIAVEAGLHPLSRFSSNPDGTYEDHSSQEAGALPATAQITYYAIDEGLRTVEGLIQEIRSAPKVATRLSDSAYTLDELEELARSLREAKRGGSRFCLFFM
jgi:hypothetical protein